MYVGKDKLITMNYVLNDEDLEAMKQNEIFHILFEKIPHKYTYMIYKDFFHLSSAYSIMHIV